MTQPDMSESRRSVPSDNPIRRSEDDVLGRSALARSFVRQVLALDPGEGVVVGVLGPWGSGKTSFLNLAREHIDESIPVLDFNPWMFSGAEQLVESFFVELAAQLRVRKDLADIGQDLQDYGEVFSGMAWLPLVGPWIERGRGATKLFAKVLRRRKEGVGGRRRRLEKALDALDHPIVVVLDDIDRLTSQEIRDVFKLIRLTASFPNVIYVVAFDRARVEEALAEEHIPGRDYLEKILQIGVDLPAVPDHVLTRQVFAAMDGALKDNVDVRPLDEVVWPDIFMEIIRPLIRNLRDVRRYAAAIHGTALELEGNVALADLLAMEAIRMFLPDVFARMHVSIEALTTTSGALGSQRSDPPHLKTRIDELIEAGGDRSEVVLASVNRLFPAAQRYVGGAHFGPEWNGTWLRERRVAHEDVLRLYLERIAGEGLQAFNYAEHAWSLMMDRSALDTYLRSLDADRLEDVISSIEVYEDEFAPEQVAPATIVLLNLMPELPERQRGLFEVGGRLTVNRVVLRLLRSLGGHEQVEQAVREILPEVVSLGAKQELVDLVGYREGRGHKLASEEAAEELAHAWRDEVRASSNDQLLAEEEDLLRVLFIAQRESGPSEDLVEINDSSQMTLALLRSARTESRSQMVGSRAVRRSPRLAWDVLVELYGDEETLRERFESVKETAALEDGELLELVEKYLQGWRPDDLPRR